MKKLLGIVVLGLLLGSKSFADIKDFEIEGMAIGDNLDYHYSPEIQKKFIDQKPNSTDTAVITFTDSSFKVFDQVQILYKKDSKLIKQISGILKVPDVKEISDGEDWMSRFDICAAKQKNITKDIANLSEYEPIYHKENSKMEGGIQKNKFKKNDIVLSNDGYASVVCISSDNDEGDVHLFVIIATATKEQIALKTKRKIDNVDTLIIDNENNTKFKSNDKNYALLISNSNYDYWDNLISPINDVSKIGSILEKNYGFEVEILKDGNRNDILDKLFEYSSKTSDNDNFLIYYAGHGEIINSNAYWIPKNSTKEISSKWLNVNDVNAAISLIKAKDLLVMVDACYQGTAFKSAKEKIIGPSTKKMNDKKYFEKMKRLRSRIVITSGNNEPVVDSMVDGHSLFAYKFIDILNKNNNYETSTSMFVKLNKFHAGLQQSPSLILVANWGHLGGDFIFLKK